MPETKDQLAAQPLAGYAAPLATALWRLQDARARTLKALQTISEAEVDWLAPGLQNRIGTLLYHIAAIEIDWLHEEILQQPWTAEIEALFPYPVRDADGQLHPVLQIPLSAHLEHLEHTRAYFLKSLQAVTEADYRRLRQLPRYDVSPEWIMHHLAQHEAEHRGEILTIRTLYQAALREV
ncbi:MAG: DinB family protein [Anaerolineae bacterium]|uniref:DinB family protein n=1 Tax=Candidatus Flexifilum breve TaxID=3140694 RepID=UPI001ACE5360|nr:DinB family protein [Chloroflexota bacterium]MBK9747414.1 DinB family protein [Chloroflexota bacterium]MBN8639475.1 DinB family protein [Anaerolineae bacterium]